MDNFENKSICLLGAVRLKTLSSRVYTLYNSQKVIKGEGIWTLGVLKILESANQLSYKALDSVVVVGS